jgi:hypothetical protein
MIPCAGHATTVWTVIVKLAEPVPLAFIALIVELNAPVCVGVPEINPLDAFTLSPEGSPIAV